MVGTIQKRLGTVDLRPPETGERTLDDLIRWFEKAMPKSLAKIRRKKGPAFDLWITHLANTGDKELPDEPARIAPEPEYCQGEIPF